MLSHQVIIVQLLDQIQGKKVKCDNICTLKMTPISKLKVIVVHHPSLINLQ